MKINDKLYGFTVTEKRYVEELSSDVYTLIFEKTGTRLTYFARDDENKTFAITFKTLPTDSTGVFHIIEHSVLCGSRKYPVKDPFVELLKGSLNTFLNALTFQDKTMYPVSSKNDKDFSNLVSIYMDAVLHPLAMKDPKAFYQEGWHYELSDDGSLSYKGVVLNEMKGDYSSPESVADRHINDMLYSGTPYQYDSGGDPDEITSLTYENYRSAHKKYYHPTHAEIFLDGSVRLDDILPLIASYLSEFEKSEVSKDEFAIPRVTISAPDERQTYYEVKDGDTTENKTRITLGYIVGDYSECEKIVGANILQRALFSTNESAVKKEIVASGLCEDMLVSMRDGILEPAVLVDFINVKDGKCDELLDLFYSVLSRVSKEGIERDELVANINFIEFQARERDFGSLPLGVANAMVSLETLLYSDDPVGNFRLNAIFKSLRDKVEGGYFESLVREIFVDNKKRATLTMIPSSTLGKEREAEEKARLEKIAVALTDKEREEIAELNRTLAMWQESEDSDEARATVPALSLDDISDKPNKIPTEQTEVRGVPVITHQIATNGIVYTELYFDVTDIEAEEAPYFALISFLLANLPTEKHTATEIQRLIKMHLGGFDARLSAITRFEGEENIPKIYFQVGSSALFGERENLVKLVLEILTETRFTDDEAIKNILRQTVIASEESFASTGHQVAMGRVGASCSVESACREYYNGYESYLVFKSLDKNFDTEKENIKARLSAIMEKYITASRLTVGITADGCDGIAKDLIKCFKNGERVTPVCKIRPISVRREGIAIPARVSFAATASNTLALGVRPDGSFDVARAIAGYEYLWGEVRVKGGAYGAGMSAGISGSVGFYSYRDPNPKRTLDIFVSTPKFIKEFAESGADITKYIIGAVGDAESLKTPRMRGSIATTRLLRGICYEESCRLRKSLLSMNNERLTALADIMEKTLENAAVCVVGPRSELEKLELDEILEI